ncbi:MAG: glycoside hydrolase family 38 C-terminal domain-containing protein, partial [Candidatus Neomarinimicrobiota bacterium]|nr:glycoside hydrolase family 38 C-terminal domain-containing protein [Candidatus Neomarinimicrobiota bacterium]
AANTLFGVFTDPDPEKESIKRHGWFDAKVECMRFGIFDSELWHLYLDVRILLGFVKRLDEKSVRRSRAILALNNCINAFADNQKNSEKARSYLKQELEKQASASDLYVSAIGHAHIDTGWLWPVRETVRKCARTFATQLSIIDEYPDYIFGASQPQHYQFIKDHYPELYVRIKNAVKSGNWEVQGGMWVEADCNLISGESMVRQLLHGMNFFKDEFGIEVDNLWLPDVFGYSAALPQILKKSGINYFLTQKLSWSQFNDFPYQTFNWRGIDGTEILTHFPPENTYNSELDTEFLIPAQQSFKEKDKIDEFISLFGMGDGGGGPKPENVELGRRMANLENSPRVRFDTAKNFFHRLDKYKDDIETWVGELYLELHRGTYTSHGLVKKQNRKLEWRLRAVEMLWSCLPMKDYPTEELEILWKKLLINQFHDIIPGSSINLVYQTTHKEYEEIHDGCDKLILQAAQSLFEKSPDAFVLANTLSYVWKGIIVIPESMRGYAILDEDGQQLSIQETVAGTVAAVDLAPLSFATFKKGDPFQSAMENEDNLILENDFIVYEFDQKGQLISAYDKEVGKKVLSGEGNVLSLYEDRPNDYDAWDVDFFYRAAIIETATMNKDVTITRGNAVKQLVFSFRIGKSTIKQSVSLYNHSKRIDFSTTVDWNEKHKMLRVHFPVNVRSDQATFDIQYGYVKRNTHRNTSWDKAMFEVVGHKSADLSDHDYGVALLNDCKYGYMVHDNILDLNLLRSPTNPDPNADEGSHQFTYSLFPHIKDFIHSDIIAESSCLNQPPILFKDTVTKIKMPIRLEGAGIELSVLKKAEKEDELILRIIETHGRKSNGLLYIQGTLAECDLMEWKQIGGKIKVDESIQLDLEPFEIRTFRYNNIAG